MQYRQVIPAVFLSRPNRFLAVVETGQGEETVHVKNTGRCRELLVPGCRVYLSVSENPARKTRCDLIAVEKERPGKSPLLVNIDSQAPNDAAEEWLRQGELFGKDARVHREVTFGNSRFDFCVETDSEKTFLEVKGCTLEDNGIARFPDAPTERGVRHVLELAEARKQGYGACLLFVVQMREMRVVTPNYDTHPAFGEALCRAAAAGVRVMARDCLVTPDSLTVRGEVPVCLTRDPVL